MADTDRTPPYELVWLREDLQKEYYAILDVVNGFDQRLMTIKAWSVTLSLAAIATGFNSNHYALFALARITALGFWLIDAITKRHQVRYYSRMRDIEVATFRLNHVCLGELPKADEAEALGEVSAPRIDMSWSFKGYVQKKAAEPTTSSPDWRTDIPLRRTPGEIHNLLRRPYWMPHVLLPHAVAVVLGLLLFIGALAHMKGLAQLQP